MQSEESAHRRRDQQALVAGMGVARISYTYHQARSRLLSLRLIVTGADTGGLERKLQVGVRWQGAGCLGVFLSTDWLQGYLSSMLHTGAVS